ncbi:MAG: cyclic pyranopterin monophosphate synthase MoaC [Anaeromyxobacter sp.]
MKMIDVGAKPKTERVAIARGRIVMLPETVARILRGDVEKGDVLAACRLAGVLAAKHTPDIVPLCHPIALSNIEVEATPGPDGVEVVATVKTVDRTGVEMEALAAVMAALLTIYDMLKRYEHGMVIERVELAKKDGGRTGLWLREGEKPAAPARKPRAAAPAKRRR